MNDSGHRIVMLPPLAYGWQRLKQYVLFLTVAIIALVTSGCAEINIRFGNRPDPAVLETNLRIGESTSTDVQRILGKPYGRGKELLPVFGKEGFMLTARKYPRDVMAYYYEESTMEDSRRIILYVYLDKGRYDGYMWFSSLPGTREATIIQPAIKPSVKPAMKITPKLGESVEKPAKQESALNVRYPHRLIGVEIGEHFKRYKRFTFYKTPGVNFTITIEPDGELVRYCPKCLTTEGSSTLNIKEPQGLVCMNWSPVTYPSSSCFELIQIAEKRYQLVDPIDGETYGYTVP